MIKINIPEAPAKIIGVLEKYGYEAYIVGGCVRDAILGREPNDWDVTTSCPAFYTKEIFDKADGFDAHPTGMEHGTVTVCYGGEAVEVTTFRMDAGYADHRHPSAVFFSDNLHEDLARRDFTVCAMAYSDRFGLVDIYGGVTDIESRIIRCVGDSRERFNEDALRIMRALRFSSQLGFDIHGDTANAARALAHTLAYISKERITEELAKLLLGKNAPTVMREYADIISHAAPMLKAADIAAAGECAKRLSGASLSLMLACLLIGASEESVNAFFKWLRFDNKTVKNTKKILTFATTPLGDKIAVKRMCRDIGAECASDAIKLGIASGVISEDVFECYRSVIEGGECYSLMQLDIDGHDLIALGCVHSFIGQALDALLDMVICSEVENNREALINTARALMDEDGYIPERK